MVQRSHIPGAPMGRAYRRTQQTMKFPTFSVPQTKNPKHTVRSSTPAEMTESFSAGGGKRYRNPIRCLTCPGSCQSAVSLSLSPKVRGRLLLRPNYSPNSWRQQCSFGAESPASSDCSVLVRRDIVVWPDNDSAGL